MSTTQTDGRRRRRFGLVVLTASVGVAVGVGVVGGLAGCEEESSTPPASGSSGGSSTGGGTETGTAKGNQGNGALSHLSEEPKSLYGRSAKRGKDVARLAEDKQAQELGTAQDLTGESVPVEVAGLEWHVPTAWEKVSPSGMRKAEFHLKDSDGGPAVVIFSHFRAGGGGVDDNIKRWAAQMHDSSGQAILDPDVHTRTIAGVRVTRVAMEGTYLDGMPGQTPTERSGYAFRGAIVEGPQGNVFIKLTGPKAVVEAADAAWDTMISGVGKK